MSEQPAKYSLKEDKGELPDYLVRPSKEEFEAIQDNFHYWFGYWMDIIPAIGRKH